MNNDLISREALKEDFKTRLETAKIWEENALHRGDDEIAIRAKATIDFICDVIMTIDNAPTAGPLYTITSNTFVEGASMRPQGEWIDVKDIPYLANCSHCGYQMDTHEERGYFRFCPYCGTDMRKGGAE